MNDRRKTIALLPAHPAQLWVLRPIAQALAESADIIWVLRDKDCLLALADRMGLNYTVLSRAGRGLCSNMLEFARNLIKTVHLTRTHKIDFWITKYGAGNIAAALCGARSISFNDDDADIVPFIAWTSYPFADCVLAPQGVRMGRFAGRAVHYPGYHELFYLHPDRFASDPAVFAGLGITRDQPFAIVRLVALQAHHDLGARGMSLDFLRRIIQMVDGRIRLFISSERPLPAAFEALRCPLPPDRIHHALAFAEFFVGDSQTMNLEAAQLGTPAFRLSSFVGRISVIEQLERYGLSFGFRPGHEDQLLLQLQSVLDMPDRRAEFQRRRSRMLADKSDPLPFFVATIKELLNRQTVASPAGLTLEVR